MLFLYGVHFILLLLNSTIIIYSIRVYLTFSVIFSSLYALNAVSYHCYQSLLLLIVTLITYIALVISHKHVSKFVYNCYLFTILIFILQLFPATISAPRSLAKQRPDAMHAITLGILLHLLQVIKQQNIRATFFYSLLQCFSCKLGGKADVLCQQNPPCLLLGSVVLFIIITVFFTTIMPYCLPKLKYHHYIK